MVALFLHRWIRWVHARLSPNPTAGRREDSGRRVREPQGRWPSAGAAMRGNGVAIGVHRQGDSSPFNDALKQGQITSGILLFLE